MMPRSVEITVENRQNIAVDTGRLSVRLAESIRAEGPVEGELIIALVDDVEMQRINCEFLDHDWPTDVVSFSYVEETDSADSRIDGELVVSVDTAQRQARQHGWSLDDELLLYCVHGFLHLRGYDDLTDDARVQMRQRECELLGRIGLVPQGLPS
ncbi:MAG: rRNA maturation RNase YbeY [Planctomycetaceae bacterium]|nr:rRNA maturation RNase YbeY [Planctomycetaceae bacterium]